MKRIPLRSKEGTIRAHALVDDCDFEWLSQWRWCLGTKGYAMRRARPGGTVRMARVIVGLETGDPRQVDHINRDTLDNRRTNLRVVTQAQNRQNLNVYRSSSSRFRGVRFVEPRKPTHAPKWVAYARLNGKLHHLGTFRDETKAAEVAAQFRAEHMPFSAEALTA